MVLLGLLAGLRIETNLSAARATGFDIPAHSQ
jgi:hypothetical protein